MADFHGESVESGDDREVKEYLSSDSTGTMTSADTSNSCGSCHRPLAEEQTNARRTSNCPPRVKESDSIDEFVDEKSADVAAKKPFGMKAVKQPGKTQSCPRVASDSAAVRDQVGRKPKKRAGCCSGLTKPSLVRRSESDSSSYQQPSQRSKSGELAGRQIHGSPMHSKPGEGGPLPEPSKNRARSQSVPRSRMGLVSKAPQRPRGQPQPETNGDRNKSHGQNPGVQSKGDADTGSDSGSSECSFHSSPEVVSMDVSVHSDASESEALGVAEKGPRRRRRLPVAKSKKPRNVGLSTETKDSNGKKQPIIRGRRCSNGGRSKQLTGGETVGWQALPEEPPNEQVKERSGGKVHAARDQLDAAEKRILGHDDNCKGRVGMDTDASRRRRSFSAQRERSFSLPRKADAGSSFGMSVRSLHTVDSANPTTSKGNTKGWLARRRQHTSGFGKAELVAGGPPEEGSLCRNNPKPGQRPSTSENQTSNTSTCGEGTNSNKLNLAAEALLENVKVQDRRHRLRLFKKCFVGSEAVDVLVESGMAKSREDAVQIGQTLASECQLFEHVCRDKEFQDDRLFYRFLENERALDVSNNSRGGKAKALATNTGGGQSPAVLSTQLTPAKYSQQRETQTSSAGSKTPPKLSCIHTEKLASSAGRKTAPKRSYSHAGCRRQVRRPSKKSPTKNSPDLSTHSTPGDLAYGGSQADFHMEVSQSFLADDTIGSTTHSKLTEGSTQSVESFCADSDYEDECPTKEAAINPGVETPEREKLKQTAEEGINKAKEQLSRSRITSFRQKRHRSIIGASSTLETSRCLGDKLAYDEKASSGQQLRRHSFTSTTEVSVHDLQQPSGNDWGFWDPAAFEASLIRSTTACKMAKSSISGKDTESDEIKFKKRLKALMRLPENQVCCDCSERRPTWASLIAPPPGAPPGSLPIGAFCCFECSGSHRRLGVHIAFVRSITLDTWKEREVLAMENGGNSKVNAIFEANLLQSDNPKKLSSQANLQKREQFIRDKYERRKYFDPARSICYFHRNESSKIRNRCNSGEFVAGTKVRQQGCVM